jgi:hypothetical protein
VPVRKVTRPRTVSITEGLAMGRDILRERNVGTKTIVKEVVEVTGTDSFSVEAAVKVINGFVEDQKIGLSKKTAFTTYKPEISDISKITFIVENSYEEEAIKEYRGGLVKRLKQKLNNKNIEVLTRMVEAGEEKKLLVTDKQRYDYLLEKYPALDKLRKTFNLDL